MVQTVPRRSPLRTVLIVASLVLAAYVVRIALWRPLALDGESLDDGYARASGVVHVHTTFSDGSESPE